MSLIKTPHLFLKTGYEVSSTVFAVPSAVIRASMPDVTACQFGDLVAWYHAVIARASASRERWNAANPGARQLATRKARLADRRAAGRPARKLTQEEKRERWARYARNQRERIRREREAALRRLAKHDLEERKLAAASRRVRKRIERQLREERRKGIL